MANENNIKESLFRLKKKLIAFGKDIAKVFRVLIRALFFNKKIDDLNCFDVPIIINNRNRLAFLKLMINQLKSFGYKNIYILDNDSTYPPLLDYYKVVEAEVIFLNKNVGYKALWESDVFERFKNNYYVYSDPDVLLQANCPKNFVSILFKHLSNYTWKEKAGCALMIDDISDNIVLKQEIIKWEKPNWEKQLTVNVYDALVDTTLALYKPLAFGNAEECAAIRVAGNLTAQHLPWYKNQDELSEEDLYYKNNVAKTSSYWSSK
jgi:hypothetical protein